MRKSQKETSLSVRVTGHSSLSVHVCVQERRVVCVREQKKHRARRRGVGGAIKFNILGHGESGLFENEPRHPQRRAGTHHFFGAPGGQATCLNSLTFSTLMVMRLSLLPLACPNAAEVRRSRVESRTGTRLPLFAFHHSSHATRRRLAGGPSWRSAGCARP